MLVIVECATCSQPIKVKPYLAKPGQRRFCNSSCAAITTVNHRTHGLSKHPLYNAHTKIMKRCYDPASPEYVRYGARGIGVADAWHDRLTFIRDLDAALGPRPDGGSLDRIDNDRGYEPGNLRWASKQLQAVNRRANQNSTSSRIGVSWDARRSNWRAQIMRNGRRTYIGAYATEAEASAAYNAVAAVL